MSLKAVITLISNAEGELGHKALMEVIDTFRRLAPKERKALIALLSKEEVAHAMEIMAGVDPEELEYVGQLLDRVQKNGNPEKGRPGSSGADRVRKYIDSITPGTVVRSKEVAKKCNVTSVNTGWVLMQLVKHGILKHKQKGVWRKL